MTEPLDNDRDVLYEQWLDIRREPPDLKLDSSVLGWIDTDRQAGSVETNSSIESAWTWSHVAAKAVQLAIVATALVICVTRVCLVIFPFSELH